MASEWSYKNLNSSYRIKCQWNFDEGKGNLVRLHWVKNHDRKVGWTPKELGLFVRVRGSTKISSQINMYKGTSSTTVNEKVSVNSSQKSFMSNQKKDCSAENSLALFTGQPLIKD